MGREQRVTVLPEIPERFVAVDQEAPEQLVAVDPELAVIGHAVLETLNVTPSLSAQDILPEEGVDGFDEVLVSAIPTGSARTPYTHIDVNLKMDIEGKRVTVIAQGNESASITPVVSPGWVQTGAAGTVDASAYGEMELPLAKVQDKIVLEERPQTIVTAPGWVSEDVEIPGIDSRYVGSDVPRRSSSDLTVNGRTVTAPAGYYAQNAQKTVPAPEGEFEYVSTLYEDEITLADTTFDTWTASSTAGSILGSANKATFAADMDNYVYYLMWEIATHFAYLEGATLTAMPIAEVAVLPQAIVRRASNLANTDAHNNNQNYCLTDTASTMFTYYTTTGVETYVANNTYGVYPAATAATFSSSTGKTPTVTVKSPTMSARCSSAYFATARKPEVDSKNTKIYRRCKLYRLGIDKFGRQWEYDTMVDYYNATRTQ